MAVQQALLYIRVYDGKNMPLKTFIQDLENGYSIYPAGIRIAIFKGVIAKLRDTAKDAVSNVEVNTVANLKDALKEYEHSLPRRTIHSSAQIQGVTMRGNKTVIEYYRRIKKIMEGAKASLNEKFTVEQVPHMVTMREGIALKSFQRGL